MQEDKVIMSNWKRIWNKKTPNDEKIFSDNVEEKFMELKRLTGNDTMKNGGVSYQSFRKQYKRLKEKLSKDHSIGSYFEVGCGSGPYLFLLENEGYEIGGLDYADTLVQVAKNALKLPKELYCEEASKLDTDISYDAVFSTSAFEYFESEEYATIVLDKMVKKAKYSIAVLDVHDLALQELYTEYRRSKIENYDERYFGLSKKFFRKDFFVNYAKLNDLELCIEPSVLDGYWNQPFVFDVYMYKRG